MFYLSKLSTRILNPRNLIFISNMKRTSIEAKQSEENKHESSDDEGEENSLEPGMKRVNMPKKSKHRMRAHINPMGDLTIPVYFKASSFIASIDP
jgi:hypothetical protein